MIRQEKGEVKIGTSGRRTNRVYDPEDLYLSGYCEEESIQKE
jgi:hypothetical protein